MSDNEEFTCFENTKWIVTFSNLNDLSLSTTNKLYEYFKKHKSLGYMQLPRVPLISKPLNFTNQVTHLPMDPYEYGLMIGARISSYDIEDYLEKCGYFLQKFNGHKPPKARFTLWLNKEYTIPPEASRADMGLYLYLPLKERLAVFQGCVDSDAKIDKDFRVVFQVKNDPAKVEFYRCLASSFGFHVHDKYYKRRVHTGTDYICSFQAKTNLMVSRLEAKINKLPKHEVATKFSFKKILHISKHEAVEPQKCIEITVDGTHSVSAVIFGHLYTVVAV